jgi:PKD repeat protein
MQNKLWKKVFVLGMTTLFLGLAITPTILGNLASLKKVYQNNIYDKIFNLNIPPIANFIYEPNEIMTDDLVYFNSTSYDPDGIIVNWTWDFGDGSIAYDENVTHTYLENGDYDVNLSVLDNDSASTFIVKKIFVGNQLPVADFTYEPDEIMTDDLVYFNSTSYDPDGIIVNWTWDFGDGVMAYGEYVTHIYSDNGNYNVNLTVRDNDSATAFIVKNIFVGNQPPIAEFTFTPEYPFADEIIYFTDNSTDPDGIIVTWWWDFGDGYYSHLQNPKHVYYLYGNFTVKLSVTDDEGSIDTMEKIITVLPTNDPPYAPIITGPDLVYSGQDYTFMYQSIDPDEDNIRFTVTWGDSTENVSEFTQSNTPVILNHTWNIMVPVMILRMTATAEDKKGALSSLTEKWVIVVKTKGINSKNSIPTQKINLNNYDNTLVSKLKNRVINTLILFLSSHPNLIPILRYIIRL